MSMALSSQVNSVYKSRSIKRGRRTRADIEEVKLAICDVLEAEHPMSVRQVFYQLTTLGAIGKTEAEYKNTVVRLLSDMRCSGEIPFAWLADSTRWMRKPETHSSLEAALQNTAITYRRSLWDDAESRVEIWLEKDALSGVLFPITSQWDVPLMVTRGYPSLSFLYSAAEDIQESDKPTFIYYFGDHDPSGVDIPRCVEQGIREFAPGVELYFHRVAVNLEQIEYWNLPSRPTKRSDSRSKGFEGESVEVDSISPTELRSLAEAHIEQHFDPDLLKRVQATEAQERQTLKRLAAWGGAA